MTKLELSFPGISLCSTGTAAATSYISSFFCCQIGRKAPCDTTLHTWKNVVDNVSSIALTALKVSESDYPVVDLGTVSLSHLSRAAFLNCKHSRLQQALCIKPKARYVNKAVVVFVDKVTYILHDVIHGCCRDRTVFGCWRTIYGLRTAESHRVQGRRQWLSYDWTHIRTYKQY